MKAKNYLLFLLALLIAGCSQDDEDRNTETALFAVPVVKTLAEIRASVAVTGAQQTNSDGKIYVAEDYLFYIAQEEGVHIFDNSDPSAPQNIAFLNIEGVHDIAVKGNYLYADNFVDMLVFDISNIQNISLVNTIENSVVFYPAYPATAEFFDYTIAVNENQMVVRYDLETRPRPEGAQLTIFTDAMNNFESSAGGQVGTGGSYAKFQINNNALYTIDQYQLNVFNIANPVSAFFDKSISMNLWFGNGQFETLFRQKEFLFVGATNGMYVVDASDEFNPIFISGFSHATACDPVVVNGTTAYITVRGGSTCGAIEDQVNVIDITDIANPTLSYTYLLNQPMGLGVLQNRLYVANSAGLNVFDATTPELILKNTYAQNVTDVIPMESHLIAVAPNKIIQYAYGADFTLQEISTVNF